MKIQQNGNRRSGLVLFLIMALLAMMTAMLLSNAFALANLKREMRVIEKRQIQAHKMEKQTPHTSNAAREND